MRFRPTFGALCALTTLLLASSAVAATPPAPQTANPNAGDRDFNNAPATGKEADAKPVIRKEIAEIFNAARALVTERKFPEALAKLAEADTLPDHTPAEDGPLNQLRLAAALEVGDMTIAAKALDGLPPTVPADTRLRYTLFITQFYYNAPDYTAAIDWAKRYLAAGGPEIDAANRILAQSYYKQKDYGNAVQVSLSAIARADQTGAAPSELMLEILAVSARNLDDREHYSLALTRLVTLYPTADRWDNLIHDVIGRPGFPNEKRALDIFRLMLATGCLKRAEQFDAYATVAMQGGYPAEAASVLDRKPGDAKPTSLRATVRGEVEADQKSLPRLEAEARKAAGGDALVSLGVDYYGYRQYDKAVALIEAGIAKGKLKSPDEANLDLGIVSLAADQRSKAMEAFQRITQSGGPVELAQLWVIKAGSAR